MRKKISSTSCFKTMLSLLMMFTTVHMNMTQVAANTTVKHETRTNDEYEIYPIPQSTTYLGTMSTISNTVNVVFEEGLDQATKNRLIAILESNGYDYVISEQLDENKTNFIAGIEGSKGIVDSYFTTNHLASRFDYSKIDAHVVAVKDNVIAVLGKDSDATFYGLTTLKHVFQQVEDQEIKDFVIEDYSDALWRGFIEGYYGIPWSNEDRMSLMEFGGDFKMNAYMFAPKDDEYHAGKWREPYPEAELAGIQEMVAVGEATKNKFIWTIHPFMYNAMRFDTEENYQADLATIITKFEQMYAVGVRQFGVLGDDAGGDASDQVKLMNDLNEWVKNKEGVYNLIFVPKEYSENFSSGINSPYLKKINEMPDEIDIMWTGSSVCGWVTEATFEWFKTALSTPQKPGREATMWLNWPVNDINSARLLMGKGQMLDPNVTNFKGVISNPMQQAEASKVALFAVADYNWHRDAFNVDQSWKDGFKYIEPDASEELYIIAKHNSDPAPNGHGLVQDESEEIKVLFDEFNQKYTSGQSIKAIGATLIAEFDTIIKATEDFALKSKNENLKEEIDPWRQSLRDVALSAKYYIQTAIALEDQNNTEVWSNYSEAAAYFEQSQSYKAPHIQGGWHKVEAGFKRFIPFVKALGTKLAPKVNEIVNPAAKPITARGYSNRPLYQGSFDNLTDNNLNTFTWLNGGRDAGDYIALEFSELVEVDTITLVLGKNNSDTDIFKTGKFQYSLDGENWSDIPGLSSYGPSVYEVKVANVGITTKHLRYLQTEGSGYWAAFREFRINDKVEKEPLALSLIRSDLSIKQGTESQLVTQAGASPEVFYANTPYTSENQDRDSIPAGAYVGVDLGRVAKLGKVEIIQGQTNAGDIFDQAILEYSVDGSTWTPLKEYTRQTRIEEDFSSYNISARYVRLVNKVRTGKWARFTKFYVSESNVNTNLYTNVSALADRKTTVESNYGLIEQMNEITLQPGQYVGLMFPRIRDLQRIEANYTNDSLLTLETSMNGIEWITVEDFTRLEDARYVRIVNHGEGDVTFNLTSLKVTSLEFEPISVFAKNLNEYGGNKATSAFDGDWTTPTWFSNNQNPGSYITYDLGQVLDIDSLELVMNDFENDFIRNGKISLSLDGKNWEDAIIIGGDFGADAKIEDIYPHHKISYYTIDARNVNTQARYLKVEITKSPGISKWIRFNEIVINDGAYIPQVNDPTFISNPIEVKNHGPENVLDGNLSTTYKPDATHGTSGSLTYRVSEKTKITSLKVLQSPKTISNALVSVRTVDGWTNVGTLSKSLNDYNISGLGDILEIKFEWDGVVPTVHEVIVGHDIVVIDRTPLTSLVEELQALDTTNWNVEAIEALAMIIEEATFVLNDVYASQNTLDDHIRFVENYLAGLDTAIGDTSALAQLYEEANTIDFDYILHGTVALREGIIKAKVVLEMGNPTTTMVEVAYATLQEAMDALEIATLQEVQVRVGQTTLLVGEESVIDIHAILTNGNVVPYTGVQYHIADESIIRVEDQKVIALAFGTTTLEVVTQFEHLEASTTIEITVLPTMEALNRVPTITAQDQIIKVGTTFDPLAHVRAFDEEDGDISAFINIVTNTVSIDRVGTYIVVYEVVDSQGAMVQKTITVAVEAMLSTEEKSALAQAIEDAKPYVTLSQKYTETSFATFIEAYEQALVTYANPAANQEAVDEAIQVLTQAIQGLVVRPTTPGNSGNTNKPEQPGNSGTTNKPTNPGNSGTTNKPTTPGNGGNTNKPTELEKIESEGEREETPTEVEKEPVKDKEEVKQPTTSNKKDEVKNEKANNGLLFGGMMVFVLVGAALFLMKKKNHKV